MAHICEDCMAANCVDCDDDLCECTHECEGDEDDDDDV